jgi:hypothetical protein
MCHGSLRRALPALVLLASTTLSAESQETSPGEEPVCSLDEFYQGRIVTPDDVREGTVPETAEFWWGMGWPCRKILGGMESGLIAFERTKIREKLYDFQRRLAEAGFRPLFGGLGEGSGIGLGTIYDYPHRPTDAMHLMGRVSLLSGYQEFSMNFDKSPFDGTRFNALVDYQWRPDEPFYGFGQDSSYDEGSNFALRQTSFSFHWDQDVYTRIRSGLIYSAALLQSVSQPGGGRPPVGETFGPLAGVDEGANLQSIGAYVALDGYQGDYRLGGRGQFGASWQEGWGDPEIRYTKIEALLEGRLPIVGERSVLIGQAATEMLREGSGTSPVPFYLYPRIGGSATLRGFPLDRFYGRNRILTTIEYRFLIHPNMEVQIFHDSGQIYERTRDLSFFDWQRNFGLGFRLRNATGTQFRFEFATSSEGISVHFTFGDRPIRPLGSGPVRYPLYRP